MKSERKFFGYDICRVGIDDTDSPEGMCTTYLAALLIRKFTDCGWSVQEARLIRLNPTIKYKTRGNAAISIQVRGDPSGIFRITCDYVEQYARFECENTNPGVVVSLLKPDEAFYHKAVTDVCTIGEAEEVLSDCRALYRGYKNRRGLIGATAAIASCLPDHTWELLAYRRPELVQTPRIIDPVTFFTSEEVTKPHTWDTVDYNENTIVCVPHSGDPVLFGIRGDSPFSVAKARSCIRSEPTELEQIFRTNQGTDAHLIPATSPLKEGRSYRVCGVIADHPVTIQGGHVCCTIRSGDHLLDCMAYEPTKGFRQIIRSLIPGDRVMVCGSYPEKSLNIEKIQILDTVPHRRVRAPVCRICNKQMTSAGKDKGWKCRKCGRKTSEPEYEEIMRDVSPGWYEVPPCARRHLAKPLIRDRIGP